MTNETLIITGEIMNVEGKTDKQLRRMCVNHWKRMLKLSVEDIVNKKEDLTDDNCAFCEKYSDDRCYNCPVSLSTGKDDCEDTPFYEARTKYKQVSNGESHELKTFYKAVQKEIDFLESLEC